MILSEVRISTCLSLASMLSGVLGGIHWKTGGITQHLVLESFEEGRKRNTVKSVRGSNPEAFANA